MHLTQWPNGWTEKRNSSLESFIKPIFWFELLPFLPPKLATVFLITLNIDTENDKILIKFGFKFFHLDSS